MLKKFKWLNAAFPILFLLLLNKNIKILFTCRTIPDTKIGIVLALVVVVIKSKVGNLLWTSTVKSWLNVLWFLKSRLFTKSRLFNVKFHFGHTINKNFSLNRDSLNQDFTVNKYCLEWKVWSFTFVTFDHRGHFWGLIPMKCPWNIWSRI